MTRRASLHPDQVRRLVDLAHARELAKAGDLAGARRIFGDHGISYAAVEVICGVTYN